MSKRPHDGDNTSENSTRARRVISATVNSAAEAREVEQAALESGRPAVIVVRNTMTEEIAAERAAALMNRLTRRAMEVGGAPAANETREGFSKAIMDRHGITVTDDEGSSSDDERRPSHQASITRNRNTNGGRGGAGGGGAGGGRAGGGAGGGRG